MTSNAIKKYLHSSVITKKEVSLIRELMLENNETLQDFLPSDKKSKNYFLADLLNAALKDHKNNKTLIEEIISFKNEDNKSFFYDTLKNHKYGLTIIKNNPTLFNDNIDESFLEILQKGTSTSILGFIKQNKEKINIETIYKSYLDIKTIEGIEKEGFNFDKRILNVVLCKSNLRKPADLLKYIAKYESSCDEVLWNKTIINMLIYYNKELYDWNGRDKFGDSFYLITKLKNPTQYKWGQELNKIYYFSFSHCVEAFCNEDKLYHYPSITGTSDPISADVMHEFFQKNDIHFEELSDINLFSTFIDDFSDDVINKAIQSNWEFLFRFKNNQFDKNGHYKKDIIFDSLYNEKNKNNPIIKNERVRKAILKEYFTQTKYRFDTYDTKYFFAFIGLDVEAVKEGNELLKYSDILFKKEIKHICESLSFSEALTEKTIVKFEAEVLNKELEINDFDLKKKAFKL